MSRYLLLIILVLSFFTSCQTPISNKSDKKEDFFSLLASEKKITIHKDQPYIFVYLESIGCQSCMYGENDFLLNFFNDTLDFPKSNIVFFTREMRKSDLNHLLTEYYTFNFSKYTFIQSNRLVDQLFKAYDKSPQGATMFVINQNRKLVYYNQLKKIQNLDTLLITLHQIGK